MAQLRDRDEDFKAANLEVVVIGQGEPADLEAFIAGRTFPFELYCDPHQDAYRAYGLERGSAWSVTLSPDVLAAGVQAFSEGHRLSTVVGDVMQLPGSFVIRDGAIAFIHRAMTSSDLASPEELIEAAN
ncbi:MAG: AhpC/TSA family protein [Actinobacteria bacterium]|nr:AhpC/TSA family protein [Actinomycetota bacterium]